MEGKEIERIVHDCLDGKKESFERIVEAYQRRIFNLCFYFLGSFQDAEDATMDIFLKVYSNLSSFRSQFDFSSWIFTIAKNHLRDIARRRKVEKDYISSVEKELDDYEDDPEKVLIRDSEKRRLRKALLKLSENHRTVLIFKYYMDLSYEEIGKIMGLPRNTVASLIFRGKEELKRILEKGV